MGQITLENILTFRSVIYNSIKIVSMVCNIGDTYNPKLECWGRDSNP